MEVKIIILEIIVIAHESTLERIIKNVCLKAYSSSHPGYLLVLLYHFVFESFRIS